MEPPGLPALPLVLFVHEDKTGSTTVRSTLRAAQFASRQERWLCDLEHSSNKTFEYLEETCQHADVVIGNVENFGLCSLTRRPCRYFTVLREPVDRLVSSYNYFCSSCREQGKFCWQNVKAQQLWNASCPSMSFLHYAAIHANTYTWHFGGRRVLPDYYGSMMRGFADVKPLAISDLVAATTALTQQDMFLMWTDELDGGGWSRLERWLSGTRASAAIRQSTQINKARHANKALAHNYMPTAAERERACLINHFDCELYELLRSRSRVDAAP